MLFSNIFADFAAIKKLVLNGVEVLGLGSWTPDVIEVFTLVDQDAGNMTITDNGNGNDLTQTSLTDPLLGANGICSTDFGSLLSLDATERGEYFSPTSITTNIDGGGSQFRYVFSDGNPFTGSPASSFSFGVVVTNSAADEWTVASMTGGDPATFVTDNAGFLGVEVGVSFIWDGNDVITKVYIDGTLVITLTEDGATLGYSGEDGAYLAVLGASEAQIMTETNINTPITDAGFERFGGGVFEIDSSLYPADGTWTITDMGQTVSSVLGDIGDGALWTMQEGVPTGRTINNLGAGIDTADLTVWTVGDYDATVGSQQIGTGLISSVYTVDLPNNSILSKGAINFNPTTNTFGFDAIMVDPTDDNTIQYINGILSKPADANPADEFAVTRYIYDPVTGEGSINSLFQDGFSAFTASNDNAGNAGSEINAKGTGAAKIEHIVGGDISAKSTGLELTTAVNLLINGTPGFTGTVGSPSSITVENGIVTAVS